MTRKPERRCRQCDDQMLDVGKALATAVANLSISDDLCEDLISALLAAEECKASSALYGNPATAAATNVVLQKYINEGEAEEACVYVVKACSYSVHAIQSLQDCFPKFIQMLDAVEVKQSQYYEVAGKPAVL